LGSQNAKIKDIGESEEKDHDDENNIVTSIKAPSDWDFVSVFS
jgi:hypothetical protein